MEGRWPCYTSTYVRTSATHPAKAQPGRTGHWTRRTKGDNPQGNHSPNTQPSGFSVTSSFHFRAQHEDVRIKLGFEEKKKPILSF